MYLAGYFVMTDDWFTEFVFELVVDKQFVPAEVMAVLEQEPIVLPAWDPMGTLAKLWTAQILFEYISAKASICRERGSCWIVDVGDFNL